MHNEQPTESKKYNRIKIFTGITETVIYLAALFIYVITGLSSNVFAFISSFSGNNYVLFLLYTAATGLLFMVITTPFNFYSGFILEHKYGLSNQSFLQWLWESLKGFLVSIVIFIPLGLIFFYFLNLTKDYWWLWFSIVLIFFSVILAELFPILIFPIFYKQEPVENDELKDRILNLTGKVNLKIKTISRFNMSKTTKKGNAMFTGIGKSKRILLGDTLLEKFTGEEIETIIAHELGHYHHRHIPKNLLIGSVNNLVTFWLIGAAYNQLVQYFGFQSITAIPALPLLVIAAAVIGILQSPLHAAISRKYEYQADAFAVKTTANKEAFAQALIKLNEQNLGDKEPHPFIEWFMYSHPSLKNRLKAIE